MLFREDFCEQVAAQVSVEDLIPDLDIDAEILIGHITISMMNELEKLAPYGQGNPTPVLCATGVQLAVPAKTMGKDGTHLDLRLKQHDSVIRAIAFGKSDWIPDLADKNALYDFAFRPVVNEFRGRRNVELQLIDFRPSKTTVPSA